MTVRCCHSLDKGDEVTMTVHRNIVAAAYVMLLQLCYAESSGVVMKLFISRHHLIEILHKFAFLQNSSLYTSSQVDGRSM
jgi:hypothetical protein